MTTSPFGPVADEHDDELQQLLGPFGAAARPERSPFGDPLPPAGPRPTAHQVSEASSASGGAWPQDPFAGTAADSVSSTSRAPWEQPPAGASISPLTPFGLPTPAAPASHASVPLPRSAPGSGPGSGPKAPSAIPAPASGAASRRRVSPVLAIAVAGGAVLAGALGAFALLGASDSGSGADTATALVPAPAGTAAPTPSGTATGIGGSSTAGPTTVPAAVFAPNSRDPFAALVAGGAAAGPATATGAPPVTSGGGTTAGSVDGTAGDAAGSPVRGGSGATSGTSTGATTSGGTTAGGVPTQLTKAQVCTAVTDPMKQVEQVLTASSTGATGAVDAGLALRNPVAVLRTAVSLTSDSGLAGRLDIAASTAEALRAQLIAGTAVTSGQVATQASRDADVRSSCG